jgi:hypothetical protein
LGANTTLQADGKTNVTFNKFLQWSPIQNFITINPTGGLAVKILVTVFVHHHPIVQSNQQSNPYKTQHSVGSDLFHLATCFTQSF